MTGYPSRIAAEAAGITYRQLDYWDRTGLLKPSGQAAGGPGSHRRYTEQDVQQLRLIRRLLNAGMDLSRLRQTSPDDRLAMAMAFTLAGVS